MPNPRRPTARASADVPDLVARVEAGLAGCAITRDAALGVACSGGPDSAVLAQVCCTLAARGQVRSVALLHVDHGLRPDAGDDVAVVVELGRAYGAEVMVRRVAVARDQASLEAAARDARYQALAAMAEQAGLSWVLLAHTASDQAETVLMRIVRGTGMHGLVGIPPRRGRYLRPLLGTTRAEIDAYRRHHQIAAVTDPMNRDPGFFRVRVRHTWLPALRAENPQVDHALCRLAESAQEQRAVLEYAAAALLDTARSESSLGRAIGDRAISDRATGDHATGGHATGGHATDGHATGSLDVAALASAPTPVRRRAFGLAAAQAGLGPLEARHLRALDALVTRARAGSVQLSLPGGQAERVYDHIVFTPALAEPAALTPAAGADPGADLPRIEIAGPEGSYQTRYWRPGDRMRPARLKGRSRKLSDLFADARVPRRLRSHARVVVRAADGAIVWAEYIGLAHGAEVSVTLTGPEPVASNDVLE